ncbi:haloacid dehalogenase type II [Muricoccus radiodurans]|uniref:haloacid dehalogenase type II n=1 Tax=Muricoccus radiodurans TaxID=2231721 RepID=UPI003CF778FE
MAQQRVTRSAALQRFIMPGPDAMTFVLEPAPKVITFDCYGTLVQWYEVLLHEIGLMLNEQGRDAAEAGALLDTFSRHSRRLEAERPHRLYKDILRAGFRAALLEHGFAPSESMVERFAAAIPTMGPHPEVPDALRRLRERYKLAIFTNSDEDLIVHNVARIGVPFDFVVTAERAQAYKPSRQIFEYAYRTMGVTKDETVHVAMGMFLDMKACHELGVRGIWVNRLGQAGNPDWLPYADVANLDEAVTLLMPS